MYVRFLGYFLYTLIMSMLRENQGGAPPGFQLFILKYHAFYETLSFLSEQSGIAVRICEQILAETQVVTFVIRETPDIQQVVRCEQEPVFTVEKKDLSLGMSAMALKDVKLQVSDIL